MLKLVDPKIVVGMCFYYNNAQTFFAHFTL